VSPERLWRLSAALRRRGHKRLALAVKKVNSAIYHNSLAPGAVFSPDVRFGHHGFGTVIHSNVVIGERVKIWQNVTIAVRAPTGAPQKSIRIGRGARIGAGAVVAEDVPAGATVVSVPPRVLLDHADGD
jgi:serine O-acetyltransferase